MSSSNRQQMRYFILSAIIVRIILQPAICSWNPVQFGTFNKPAYQLAILLPARFKYRVRQIFQRHFHSNRFWTNAVIL